MENIFGEVGLMQGGESAENRICTLSYGYFGVMCPIIWSGSIMSEPDSSLYARVWGPQAVTLRLSSVLLKVVSTKDGLVYVDP